MCVIITGSLLVLVTSVQLFQNMTPLTQFDDLVNAHVLLSGVAGGGAVPVRGDLCVQRRAQ